VIRSNDHLTGNALLGAGAVHHIMNCREQVQQNNAFLAQILVLPK